MHTAANAGRRKIFSSLCHHLAAIDNDIATVLFISATDTGAFSSALGIDVATMYLNVAGGSCMIRILAVIVTTDTGSL